MSKKVYSNASMVKEATYEKNNTSGMYGYLDKGYTTTITYADGTRSQSHHNTERGAKSEAKKAVGK